MRQKFFILSILIFSAITFTPQVAAQSKPVVVQSKSSFITSEIFFATAGTIVGLIAVVEILRKAGYLKNETEKNIDNLYYRLFDQPNIVNQIFIKFDGIEKRIDDLEDFVSSLEKTIEAIPEIRRDSDSGLRQLGKIKELIEDDNHGLKNIRKLYQEVSHITGDNHSKIEQILMIVERTHQRIEKYKTNELLDYAKKHDAALNHLERVHPDPVEGTPRHFCSAEKFREALAVDIGRLNNYIDKAITVNKEREGESLVRVEKISVLLDKIVFQLGQLYEAKIND
jgi:archaellum component FlaC